MGIPLAERVPLAFPRDAEDAEDAEDAVNIANRKLQARSDHSSSECLCHGRAIRSHRMNHSKSRNRGERHQGLAQKFTGGDRWPGVVTVVMVQHTSRFTVVQGPSNLASPWDLSALFSLREPDPFKENQHDMQSNMRTFWTGWVAFCHLRTKKRPSTCAHDDRHLESPQISPDRANIGGSSTRLGLKTPRSPHNQPRITPTNAQRRTGNIPYPTPARASMPLRPGPWSTLQSQHLLHRKIVPYAAEQISAKGVLTQPDQNVRRDDGASPG